MFRMIYLDEVDSTNSYIKRNINTISDNSLVYTFNQKAGYGQQKSAWYFTANKDLACSFLIKPNIPADKMFYLNIITSLAVLETLKTISAQEVKIKWPNDILMNGKKISGILIENQFYKNKIASSIIGIGVNVNSSEFGEVRFPATSLFLETKKLFLLEEIVFKLMLNFGSLLNNHTQSKDKYLQNLWRYKEKSLFKDKKGIFEGKISGVSDSGELLVLDSDKKVRRYFFKEVEFLI